MAARRQVYKDSLAFSGNYYFPLTGWKTSAAHELHDERPAYGFDLRTKGTLPDFPWFSGELTYEPSEIRIITISLRKLLLQYVRIIRSIKIILSIYLNVKSHVNINLISKRNIGVQRLN